MYISQNLAIRPFPFPDAQFNSGQPPILAMIMPRITLLLTHTRSRLRLLFIQDRQQAKDQGDAGIQLHAHQPVRDSLGDVLEVHGLALDEDADGDQGIERRCGGRRSPDGRHTERREVARRGAEKVACAEGGAGCGLDLRCGVESGWWGEVLVSDVNKVVSEGGECC